jgi:hypothetical protein
VRDFGGLAFDFAAKANHEGDDFALDFLPGSRRGEEDQGQVEVVREGERLVSQGLCGWSGYGNGSNVFVIEALQQVGQRFSVTAKE